MAAKEYAVQCATEQLEFDVKNMEFTFDNGPVAGTKITRKINEVIVRFEEFNLRSGVLKNNPFIKNFVDRLSELEKIVK